MNPLMTLWSRISIAFIADRLKSNVRKQGFKDAWIRWYGAYWIHPRHLVFWVCVRTTAERDKLKADTAFWDFARSLLIRYRYPECGREGVWFDTESEEALGGDWLLLGK